MVNFSSSFPDDMPQCDQERDLSIILSRALEEDMPLDVAVALPNCRDNITAMLFMVDQEIGLRLSRDEVEQDPSLSICLSIPLAKTDLLTRQLESRNIALTKRQLRTLRAIKTQLEHEIEKIDKPTLIHLLQREAGYDICGYPWSYFIEVGERNLRPVRDSWGHMVINENDDYRTVRDFILGEIVNIMRFHSEISRQLTALDQSVKGDLAPKKIYLMIGFSLSQDEMKLITPDQFMQNAKEVARKLIDNPGIQGEVKTSVGFHNRNALLRSTEEIPGEKHILITINVQDTPEQMAAYILEQIQKAKSA